MNGGRLCLLIVEDEKAHVEAIRRAFEKVASNVEIRAVGTLREFRADVADHPPDVALVDLNLPDGQATDVLTIPAADAPFPILVMTAYGNQEIVVKVMKAGALDYVIKSSETFESMPQTMDRAFREWRLIQKDKQAEAALRKSHDELERRVEERTEELNLVKKAAETANRAKSDFLANMSHELRTPLSAVIGFSELLQEKLFGSLNPKQEEYVNDILESGRHLLSLINDILDLAKIEAGKMELELTIVPIATLLEDSLVMVKQKCLKQGISLSLDVAEPVQGLLISVDDRKLKQVMFNLLSNAVKFTPEGGQIRVSANLSAEYGSREAPRSADHSATHTPTHSPTPTLLISVSDSGIGIDSEHQGKLFTEFYQVNGAAKGKTAGTGLGLALVKRMVEQHGGLVWLESNGDGKGCTFLFTIPLGQNGESKCVQS